MSAATSNSPLPDANDPQSGGQNNPQNNGPLDKQIIFVAGLPRSGSTLLCQLLGEHPLVDPAIHSSPLFNCLTMLRERISDNEFFLAQLDPDFDATYGRLDRAFRGFVNGWFANSEYQWVVDKNRGWLSQVDLVKLLNPRNKILICVRELGQIYGSIEAQHQKTLWIDFPDNLARLSAYDRGDRLFGNSGVVGSALNALKSVQDLPQPIQADLFYVVFEHLMLEPIAVMNNIYQWLGLPPHTINPQDLTVRPHESDSYYRFKYRHQTRQKISPPSPHSVSLRMEKELRK
ncbi:MAG: sulfotransferase, partial [Cyanobacteria bacterium P01_F01_bin.153]